MNEILDGQIAIVTGGSRGIGRAAAALLAKHGARVAVAARDGEKAREVAAEIGGIGVACDVADPRALDALFATVDRELGRPSILVGAAGISFVKDAFGTTRDDLSAVHGVNFQGGVRAAQLAAERMKGQGGAIVLVSSIWGLGGQTHQLAYGTSKAALAHAVKVMAIEWCRHGIRVNGLAPGLVDTDMTAGLDDATRKRLVDKIPMRRGATPEEMAGPILFLASSLSSYVTGHILVADGGERAR